MQLEVDDLTNGRYAFPIVSEKAKRAMTTIDSWEEVAPRPDWCVGLDAQSGRSVLTPEDVRLRYSSRPNPSITIIWRTSGPPRAGVISEHGEVAWNVDPGDGGEIAVLRPGKGSGRLTLRLKNGAAYRCAIAFSRRYMPEYDTWMRSVGTAVDRVLSVPLVERDDGFDA